MTYSTEYRPVDSAILSSIRNQVTLLQMTSQNIDRLLDSDELWMSINDLPLWEVVVDRLNEVTKFLYMFNNISEPISSLSSHIRDRVYQLTGLTRSLQRSLST